MNAWHFWWIYSCSEPSCGNGALWPQGRGNPDQVEPTKRLWVMGNFSRFARPGARRIEATLEPENDVKVTAYRDSSKSKISVVILNSKNSEFNAKFDFGTTKIASFRPYVTDETRNLEAGDNVSLGGFGGNNVESSEGVTKCSYNVPPRSATTVVFSLWKEATKDTSAQNPGDNNIEAISIGNLNLASAASRFTAPWEYSLGNSTQTPWANCVLPWQRQALAEACT